MGIRALSVEKGVDYGIYHTKFEITGNPLVSVIIPNKDHTADLDVCMRSLIENGTYKNLEFIIVENNSTEPETFQYYERIQKEFDFIHVVKWEREFNYSAINNFGVTAASGEYLLFLNNDTELINPESIEELLGFCQRDDVGIVGARLLYSDDTIQHAGVVVGFGGIAGHTSVRLSWVDSENITEKNCGELLQGLDGILVPGGFGSRGTEGKILAVQYARENKIPFLGICLGMQAAIIEFARNILGYHDANSIELDPNTLHPVIALMPEQNGVEDLGGTLRLGSYPCKLKKGTKSSALYGKEEITERHRHRYEVNNDYRERLEENGMTLAGLSPDGRIVEMIELTDHPFFVGTQGHPELKSRPNHAHPLFAGLVCAAVEYKKERGL